MALHALHPLVQTINYLLNSPRISVESPIREILKTAENAVWSIYLLVDLTTYIGSSKRMEDVEAYIKEAAHALEDALDSHVSDQFLGVDYERTPLSLDLRAAVQDVVLFTQKMMNIDKVFNPWSKEEEEDRKVVFELISDGEISRSRFMSWYAVKAASIFLGTEDEYIQELEILLPEEGYDYGVLLSDLPRKRIEHRYLEIKDGLMYWWIDKAASFFMKEKYECIPEIVNPLPEEKEEEEEEEKDDDGISSDMIGSTDLFRRVRDDLIHSNRSRITLLGMAGIGKTGLVRRILEDPLVSSKFECRIFLRMGPECELKDMLRVTLAQLNPDGDQMLTEGGNNGYAHLFEALWQKKYIIVFDDVWNISLVDYFLSRMPKSSALLTTRVGNIACSSGFIVHRVPFLDTGKSWDLLRRKIFAENVCPREFEKSGKKIAENCEGLPLLIITVANLLSKAEKTPEYWSEIAANKTNSIFVDAYERILKVLYPSYNYLPQHLKTCFHYMGAFPQNSVVRMSKLINLWSSEGFLNYRFEGLYLIVNRDFDDLVSHNVALEPPRSYMNNHIKNCSLHSVFWYLSKRVAWDDKFLHVLNSYKDARVEDIESRRRLSFYKNIILSIKDVCDSIASMPAVRSLLCTGPYHQYQVPIMSLGLRLLKILDALTIRFHEFPLEVLKLFHLRYLALTCNENLPPSISKLWKLKCLIVHQHLSIKSKCELSYVPLEIWDLQELEYLQIMGRDLPDPPTGVVLTNLLILLDVGAQTITKRVVESIPNLEKLRVQIELVPDAVVPLSRCFYDDISRLEELQSLQCVVANPILTPHEVVIPVPLGFTSCLRKLTLCGFGYPWKDMEIIAGLSNLRMLKLQCYAFRGEKWEYNTGFESLEYLSIEDTDLVHWTSNQYRTLDCLSLKNCYNLLEIPCLLRVSDIWLVDCRPSVETSAKKMTHCDVHVDYSWLDR